MTAMPNELEKSGVIGRNELDEAAYFESLIGVAAEKGVLCAADIERIQIELIELLAKKSHDYTNGDSASIPAETAQELLQSAAFTIGVYLKSFTAPDEALGQMRTLGLRESCNRGYKRLEILIKAAKMQHRIFLEKLLRIENEAYTGTLVFGIEGFFKLYEPYCMAHKINITADYRLMEHPDRFSGVEFIIEYLRTAQYENSFMLCFSKDAVNRALSSYAAIYETSVAKLESNIFEIILTSALCCSLAGDFAGSLCLTAENRDRAAEALEAGGELSLAPQLEKVTRELRCGQKMPLGAIDYLGRVCSANETGLRRMMLLIASGGGEAKGA